MPSPSFDGSSHIIFGKAGIRVTKPGGTFHMVIRQSEASYCEDRIRDRLYLVSPSHSWKIKSTTLGKLGIPSETFPSNEDVWHITTKR